MKFSQILYIFCFVNVCLLSCTEDQKNHNETFSFKKGKDFFNQNQYDSSYKYFVENINLTSDTIETARSLTYMGIIQFYKGDYYGSQEVLSSALSILDINDQKHIECLISIYNELGRNHMRLKNYDQSVQYYDNSLALITDENVKNIALNNKALVLQKAQRYDEAIKIYENLININTENRKRYARVLSNLTRTKWLNNSNDHILEKYREALAIRLEEKDIWGLNASYAHLSEYFEFNGMKDSSLKYAHKMYSTALQIESPDDQLEALKKIVSLESDKNNYSNFNIYLKLNDSLQESRMIAKNQFALIRYESEKAKADNAVLEKKNREQLIFIVIIIFLSIVVTILCIQYIKNVKRNNKVLLNEFKLKTSKKVHDVVANGLYELMSKVEYNIYSDKELLLDELEHLYLQSRNISNEQIPFERSESNSIITEKIKAFPAGSTLIHIVGNVHEIEKKLGDKEIDELIHVIRELLVNMKKHSQSKNVVLKFEVIDKQLKIKYKDDGVGILENVGVGSGLKNTENRIQSIGGVITFDSSSDGLVVNISIPYNY